MSLINKKVADFAVQAYHDGDFTMVKSEDVKGRWGVFVFYPADFTFVCPTELGDFADLYPEFEKIDCEVYSVSTDTHFTHKAWADASPTIEKIRYPMLADPKQELTRDFEVMDDIGLALRGTFVVNPQLEIVAYEVNSPNVGRNAGETLRKVQAAQYVAKHGDEVCPANWKPGATTLKPGVELVGKL